MSIGNDSMQSTERPSEIVREKRFRAAHQISQDKLFAKQVNEQWKAETLLTQARKSQTQSVKEEGVEDGGLPVSDSRFAQIAQMPIETYFPA
jgi:hypothetical protein